MPAIINYSSLSAWGKLALAHEALSELTDCYWKLHAALPHDPQVMELLDTLADLTSVNAENSVKIQVGLLETELTAQIRTLREVNAADLEQESSTRAAADAIFADLMEVLHLAFDSVTDISVEGSLVTYIFIDGEALVIDVALDPDTSKNANNTPRMQFYPLGLNNVRQQSEE